MTGPRRIQQKREKGWRKPAGAVSVARPSRWGNPYLVSDDQTAEQAVANYQRAIRDRRLPFITETDIRKHLRGKDLMCFCPLGQPCHADVLLKLANQESPQ